MGRDFLRSKGWDDKHATLNVLYLFRGTAGLLEEYARLQPYDPSVPRFPSEEEIKEMASKYANLEGYNNISRKSTKIRINMVKIFVSL